MQPVAPLAADSALPLLGIVAVKCAHPHAHFWCDGRIHVPKQLHFDLFNRLGTLAGETAAGKTGRLVAFYARTNATLPSNQTVPNVFKFFEAAFHREFIQVAEVDRRHDAAVRRALGPSRSDDDAPAIIERRQRQEDRDRWRAAREAEAIAAIEAMTPDEQAVLRAEAERELVTFKPRMTPEVYAQSVQQGMIRLLVERARDTARQARNAAAS